MKNDAKNLFFLLIAFAAFFAMVVVYSIKVDQAARELVGSGRIPASNSRTIEAGPASLASLI